MNAFDVERILSVSNDELSNLRAPACKDCGSRECLDPCCDRGCLRHATTLVNLGDLQVRFVCARCVEDVECACGCGDTFPRWKMTYTGSHDGGGEWFGPRCCGIDAGEGW